MIDLYTHILPDFEDGAATIEESLKMCQIARNDGKRVENFSPVLRGN
ncbi:MAG: hypothetical protein NT096_04645 [Proteobacteria bacterium]|nr:hypothetical protein [Pseudomonadota bacterium]